MSLRDDPKRVAIICSLLAFLAAMACVVAAIVEIGWTHQPDNGLVWAVLAIFFEKLIDPPSRF